jgi:uncharacterized DUF497 family protein
MSQLAWKDPLSQAWIDEREDYGEERMLRLSLVGNMLLYVCYTETKDDGDEVIRIISAREATKRERKIYEEG